MGNASFRTLKATMVLVMVLLTTGLLLSGCGLAPTASDNQAPGVDAAVRDLVIDENVLDVSDSFATTSQAKGLTAGAAEPYHFYTYNWVAGSGTRQREVLSYDLTSDTTATAVVRFKLGGQVEVTSYTLNAGVVTAGSPVTKALELSSTTTLELTKAEGKRWRVASMPPLDLTSTSNAPTITPVAGETSYVSPNPVVPGEVMTTKAHVTPAEGSVATAADMLVGARNGAGSFRQLLLPGVGGLGEWDYVGLHKVRASAHAGTYYGGIVAIDLTTLQDGKADNPIGMSMLSYTAEVK